MANASRNPIDIALFADFKPLNGLDRATLDKLARHAKVETISAGDFLFERGDTKQRTFYLLEGEIELCSPLFPTQKVAAKTEAGQYPVAHSFPRQFTAVTVSNVRALVLPMDISELMNREDNNAKESNLSSQDWEKRWLASPLLRRLSPEHKQSLLASMEEIPVEAGQVVIHQDEPADSYYVIKKGRCSVSRKPSSSARDVKLAELSEGQGFGEEALITGVPRNASVSMLTDGTLLRLGKEEFITQMAKPLLHHLPFEHAIKLVEQGAVLVDVRTPEEFETDGLIGSLNMPLPVLRLKAGRINRDRTYIVYSNAGQTSSVAVFLMLQQGLNACVLEGGLNNAPKSRMKSNGFNEGATPGMVLPFPNNAATRPAPAEESVDWNNLSDDVLWRTTLGYRDDAGVEAALSAQPRPDPLRANDGTMQGFDDIRLFTTIGDMQDIRLESDDHGSQEGFPPTEDTNPFTNPAPAQRRSPSPSPDGQQKKAPAIPELWQQKQPISVKRLILIVFAIMLVIGGGWLGYSYMTSGKLPEKLEAASPMLLDQQRKLDAKINRLLDALETLPAVKGIKKSTDAEISSSNTEPAPTPEKPVTKKAAPKTATP